LLLFKYTHTKWSQQHSILTFVEEPFWISHYWLHREGMMLNLSQIANQSDTSSPDHPRQSQRSRSLVHFWLLFLYTCLKCSKMSLSTISILLLISTIHMKTRHKETNLCCLFRLKKHSTSTSQKCSGIIPLLHSPKMLLCSAH